MPNQHIHDADHPASGREALSALFDGELHDEAGRFAMRRLAHDVDLREACGRWQLAGDVLRGHIDGVAPAGFAERVGQAVAMPETMPLAAGGHGSRRRWIGGAALAASIGMAALFVTRPADSPQSMMGPAEPLALSAPASMPFAEPALPADDGAAPAGSGDRMDPGAGSGVALAAGALAAAEVPRRAAERRRVVAGAQRSQEQAGLEAPAIDTAPDVRVADAGTATAPDATLDSGAAHPFLLPEEITSRPWPRTVLPGYPARRAMTASYGPPGAPDAEPPSFYPFGPGALGLNGPGDAGAPAAEWPRH